MGQTPAPVDFDSRPPMPLNEYEQTMKRVQPGYDFLFTLMSCFLRALGRPALDLLVVGAGGGAEIERFLSGNPDWHLTGVDPSEQMLLQAQNRADRLGLHDRVTLVRGVVQDLQPGAAFDAATCVFVLHFLPEHEQLTLLREIAARLKPRAPLLLATPAAMENEAVRSLGLAAWQQYGELMGMPADQMGALIARLEEQPLTPQQAYVELLHEAGFKEVELFFSALAIKGWVAQRPI